MAHFLDPRAWLSPLFRSWMRRSWDRRARENALYYVQTQEENWTEEDFFKSGEMNVQNEILNDMENISGGSDPKQMRALEIGCGVGRTTRALAAVFGEVHGIDVSGEMVERARKYLHDTPNAHVYQNNGSDLKVLGPLTFDFAFSHVVFQHIPSKWVVRNYVREVSRRLRPGGLFKFQVGGRALGKWYETNTWLGVWFTEEEILQMAGRHGFEVRYRNGAGTQYFWLWFFKR